MNENKSTTSVTPVVTPTSVGVGVERSHNTGFEYAQVSKSRDNTTFFASAGRQTSENTMVSAQASVDTNKNYNTSVNLSVKW